MKIVRAVSSLLSTFLLLFGLAIIIGIYAFEQQIENVMGFTIDGKEVYILTVAIGLTLPTFWKDFARWEAYGTGSGTGLEDSAPAPPLPPPSRHMQRGGSMQRSHSVQDSGLRPPNFTHLPPLPPYSQRSCSSDTLIRTNMTRRPHLRTIPTHGPHMASTASFKPVPQSVHLRDRFRRRGTICTGGSECYVTMSSRSDATYLPSTHSDPGTVGRAYRPTSTGSSNPPMPSSDTSGAPSDLYITSVDSECSGASYRVNNSPPPLYREVDEEHSVPLNFDSIHNWTNFTRILRMAEIWA